MRSALLVADPDDPVLRRRRSSKISRLLTLLRAHGLIKKVPHTHRYLLTTQGAAYLPALVAVRETSLNQFKPAA